jgi:hypothetical protein
MASAHLSKCQLPGRTLSYDYVSSVNGGLESVLGKQINPGFDRRAPATEPGQPRAKARIQPD